MKKKLWVTGLLIVFLNLFLYHRVGSVAAVLVTAGLYAFVIGIFGYKPIKVFKVLTVIILEWHIHQSGFNIDLVLIDPDHPRLMREIKQFTLLKNRPDLLAEYVQMKKESQGFTRGRYTRQKIAFFSKYS